MRAFLPPSTFRQPLSKPQEVLSVVTLIRSRKDINTVLGVVRVDILKSDVLNMLRHGNYTEPSAAYLVDENLNIICGADSSLTLSDEELAADIHELQKDGFIFRCADAGRIGVRSFRARFRRLPHIHGCFHE